MPLLRLRQLGTAGVAALALLGAAAPALASDAVQLSPGRPLAQVLRIPAKPTVTPPALVRATRTPAATRAPASTWAVTYCGFEQNPQAKQAFQAAVDTWAGLIDTPNDNVPIRVKATFKDLRDPDVLGQAGPTDFVVLDPDNNGVRTSYPVALANAMRGRDATPSGAISCGADTGTSDGSDITAEFNSNAGKVYYGTDGQLPDASYVDFETVVLHELGHGLGFLGSMSVDSAGRGTWGAGSTYPDVFDRFTVRSSGSVQGKRLLSYANGSTALGDALTSGAVYWDGPLGKAGYNGRPPRLYAPSEFLPASSYSHLSDVDFPAHDPNSLMTPFVENNEVIREPGPVVLGMLADMGYRTPQPGGHRYTPVQPVRLLDTRSGLGGHSGRLGNDSYVDLKVTGGAVPGDAAAVVLNVTGVTPRTTTDLRVYPTPRAGSARPTVSSVNVRAGEIRANLVTVPVGENGSVRIYTPGGSPHVLADVQGWYGPGGQSLYRATEPVRIADTRSGLGGVPQQPVAQGAPLDLQVTDGPRSVPATATAVILTVTATEATAVTDVRVYPTPSDGSAAPEVSTLNIGPGETVPALVVAKIGADGKVRLQVSAGQANLVVDLSGWFDDAADGALFHVLAPQRLIDTRTTARKRIGTAGVLDVPVTGTAGVPTSGVDAVVLNVTGVDATAYTDVRAYPTPVDGTVPEVSNLNLAPRQTAADLAIVRVGDPDAQGRSQVRLRNAGGEVSLIADLNGWFGR